MFKEFNSMELSKEYMGIENVVEEYLKEADVLILGAAGFIAKRTLKYLLDFKIKKITLLDHDENELVRILREIRANPKTSRIEITIIALSMNDPTFKLWLNYQPPFDYILNFAAAKHVRTERDTWSISNLLATNVKSFSDVIAKAKYDSGFIFSVSTDKAANPTNLMGASKRLMELMMIDSTVSFRSARFANVAFSSGSLLESWLLRTQNLQVLSVPKNCKRYIISPDESGLICMLSAFVDLPKSAIYVPDGDLIKPISLETALELFLDSINLKPLYFSDFTEAMNNMNSRKSTDPWPVLLTELDTVGEKDQEVFLGSDETFASQQKLFSLKEIITPRVAHSDINTILDKINLFLLDPQTYELNEIRSMFQKIAPSLNPGERIKNLDLRV